MRTQRKILALLISIILAMSILPAAALADEGDQEAALSGYCGADSTAGSYTFTNGKGVQKTVYQNLSWKLSPNEGTDTYTLTISGSGKMSSEVQWRNDPTYSAYKDKISNAVIESGVGSIAGDALREMGGLRSISIPNTVTEIGNWAFYDSAIETITVDAENSAFTVDEDSVLYNKDKTTLVYYPKTRTGAYTLPATVTAFCPSAFANSSITSIDMSAATELTEIAHGAFQNCAISGELILPANITTLSTYSCSGLKDAIVRVKASAIILNAYAFTDTKAVDLSAVTSIENNESWNSAWYYGGTKAVYVDHEDVLTSIVANASKNGVNYVYDLNGGSISVENAATKDGYDFAGWFTDEGEQKEEAPIKEPVHAKWTLKAPTVEVTADKTNVVTGTSVTLTANAEHELEDVTYAYQWYQGDTAIEGATEASYITGSLTADAAYSCAVTASKDDETSEAATGSVAIKVSAREGTLTLSAASGEVLTTAGQVSLTYDYNGDGPVTASSSDESVATVAVDQTAKKVTVTVQKAGTAVITVSAGATDTYTAASAVYNLTVKEPAPVTPGGSSHSGSSSTPTYAVTVDSGRHGTVTVSPKSARKGAAVTITVKPDDGYELDGLTVTDASGKAVKVTEGKNGKFTFTMPASKVEVDATFTAIKEETPAQRFTDVPNGYWAEEEINWAAENGYINGNTAATFNPEGTVTRQQLWMILARLSGYQPADFTEARAWAVDNSISDGTNPGGAVSRQQLVSILYRYAVRMGYDASGSADLTAYPDHADLASYATGAMGWSVANGIVGGTAQGTLAPAGTATRAQFAVILYRFCDKVVG